jgi:hypothetical protein
MKFTMFRSNPTTKFGILSMEFHLILLWFTQGIKIAPNHPWVE